MTPAAGSRRPHVRCPLHKQCRRCPQVPAPTSATATSGRDACDQERRVPNRYPPSQDALSSGQRSRYGRYTAGRIDPRVGGIVQRGPCSIRSIINQRLKVPHTATANPPPTDLSRTPGHGAILTSRPTHVPNRRRTRSERGRAGLSVAPAVSRQSSSPRTQHRAQTGSSASTNPRHRVRGSPLVEL